MRPSILATITHLNKASFFNDRLCALSGLEHLNQNVLTLFAADLISVN
jgi:hypothetical protein